MKRKVLFVCTGNSCRSQMAEGLLRALKGDRYEAMSAGTRPAAKVSEHAVEAMKEVGIDISAQRPKPIQQFLYDDIDVVVTLCDGAKESCPALPGAEDCAHKPVADPYTVEGPEKKKQAAYRKARDEIRAWIERKF